MYVKTFLRNLLKDKTYSLLNIAGLAMGLTCASLIFLWVEDELTFNHSFQNRDHLYRIYENQTYDGKVSTFHATPGPMAASIAQEIPGIKRTARMADFGALTFALEDKALGEQGDYADADIFPMLNLPFLSGGPSREVHSVVISESMARQFFGNASPIGSSLRVNNQQDFVVTGVFQDLPANSTLHFSWLAPMENVSNMFPWMQAWGANWAATYVEVEPGADIALINRALKGYIKAKGKMEHGPESFLFAMNDWNLHDSFTNGKPDGGGRVTYVRLFSIIAWIILLIACINFMNLSTARASQRAKEVGVRKVMGAGRRGLVGQFISEALLMSLGSIIVSVLLVYAILPAFNLLIGKNLSIRLDSLLHIGYLLAVWVVTGLLAGSYPALFLSSFSPLSVLKGSKGNSRDMSAWVRKGLVITQFSISIVLIIATVIIYQQIQHVKDRKLGYNKSNLLSIPVQGDLSQHFTAVYNDLKQTGLVQDAALSDYSILEVGTNTSNYTWQGKDPSQSLLVSWESISDRFLNTMEMQLQAGRNFYPSPDADTDKVLINQAMAVQMGKEGRIGSFITDGGNNRFEIIGIVKDFLYNSMYESGGPLVLYHYRTGSGMLDVRLRSGVDIPTALHQIQDIIRKANPGYPVEYTFVVDAFDQLFKEEALTGKLASLFATLAIVISCLGLLGLAAYMVERRKKEIGIRKVLGASVGGLTRLLSRDFLRLVGLSCCIAFPVAWYLMNNWLQGYAYRTPIYWWVFAGAGLGAIGIALLTVSFQAIKAAIGNPVTHLRNE